MASDCVKRFIARWHAAKCVSIVDSEWVCAAFHSEFGAVFVPEASEDVFTYLKYRYP